jgi:hypothetical protein
VLRTDALAPTVVLAGRGSDPHVALLVRALRALGADPLVFGGQFSDPAPKVSYRHDGVPVVRWASHARERATTSVGAIWWRGLPALEWSAPVTDSGAREFADHQTTAFLNGVFRATDAYWMNHPDRLQAARHKIPQITLAHRVGFDVPKTLATNDPEEIRGFFEDCDGSVVTKIVSSVPPRPKEADEYSVYTSILRPEDLEAEEDLAAGPALYQERIAKHHELRVTVVGDVCVACRIDSQDFAETKVDWRRFSGHRVPRHSRVDVDNATIERCLKMVRYLGLAYAAIDLIVSRDGRVVFLELNPSGAWAWLDAAVDAGITDLVAGRLLGRAERT